MLISELITKLQMIQEVEGDIQVTITATLFQEGYSASSLQGHPKVDKKNPFPDVFNSTVETVRIEETSKLGKHAKLYWQTS